MHVTLDTIGILAICAAPAASALAAAVFTARLACRYTDAELDRATRRLDQRIDAEVINRARWHDPAGGELDPHRAPVPIKPVTVTTDTDPVEGHTRNIVNAIARQESMRPDRHG